MQRFYLKTCFSLLLLLLCSNNALLYSKNTPQIRFSNISKLQGLPNNNINAVVKDNLGFIWIATNDGLCRYDANNRFKVFRPDPNNPEGLKTSNIRALYFDSKNILWIGTRLGGLTRLDQSKGKWKTFLHDSEDPNSISNDEILIIEEDSKGRIWIGTENGLNLYHPETETFTSFKVNKNNPGALKASAVLSVMEDNNGWIWVGTWAGGLHLLLPSEDGNIANATFKNFLPDTKENSNNIWKVYQDNSNRYWIGTHGGGLFLMQLPKYATNKPKQQNWIPTFHKYYFQEEEDNLPNQLSNNTIHDILQDRQGRLWIGTVDGLNYVKAKDLPPKGFHKKAPEIIFNASTFDPLNPKSLIHNDIANIYEDTQGLIWISTMSGLSVHNWYTTQFSIYELFDRLTYSVNSQNIYVDKNGIGWLGAAESGLIRYDFNKNKIIPSTSNKLKDLYATAVMSLDHVHLYFTTKLGLSILNMNTLEIKAFNIPKKLLKEHSKLTIHSIYKSNNNLVWMGTEHGLFMFNETDETFQVFYHDQEDDSSISDNSINDIIEDSKGFLWVGTFNGLNRVDFLKKGKITFERFKYNQETPNQSIPSNRLTAFVEMNEVLYIGTTNGLCGYDLNTEQFYDYSSKDHKFRVQSMEKVDESGIWGSSTEGIFHFDIQTGTFNLFEKQDGLGDLTFHLNSSYLDTNGYIYFGSRKGFTKIHPNHIIKNTMPPPVFVTEIRKMNPEGEQTNNTIYQDEIKLNYDDYYLSISFSALNYNRLKKNKFAYKLEGFDENWTYVNSSMPAVYTNLDPGTYTFHVKAANNDGIWNIEGKKLTIIKKPAFWETWWFLILSIVGMIVTIAFFIKIYIKNIRDHNLALTKYNENLNKEISERKRIELALQERENFLWLLMDNIPQHVYWINKNHQFVGANASFSQSLKLKNEVDLKDKKLCDFYQNPTYVKKQKQIEKEVMQSGMAVYNEIRQIPKTEFHPSLWIESNYIPLRDKAKKVIGVLVSRQNITSKVKAEEVLKVHSKNLEYLVEQRTQELGQKNKEIKSLLQNIKNRNEELESLVKKRTQKLSESNKELKRSNNDLEQFAYIASHDLKEPLRIIGNFVGLLGRQYKTKLDQSAFEYIDFVEDGVTRMTGLINSLLTYSRVGRKEIAFQDTNLNNTLELKLLDLSQLIKEKNIKVQIDPMPTIHCEKNQIGMVLHNLLTNAIKFNNKPNPKIKVTHHTDAPDGFWKFSVADNGIGIPPEFKDQIFEIFRRLHTKQEYEGTGIGLALCLKIIDRHGGEIWIESTQGEGTTFFFTIDKNLQIKKEIQDKLSDKVLNISEN